jgi:hypothetical protein
MTYEVTEQFIKRVLADGRSMFLPLEDNGTPEWAEYKAWLEAQDGEETVLIRARNERGQYVGDDPSTPDVNEAYVEVPISEA